MKKAVSVLTFSIIMLFAVSAMAQTKVVVVPLGGKKPAGDAVAADVLKGKTFSNKDDVGLVGVRSPTPVAKTGQTPTVPITAPAGSDGALQKGATWPTPRFTDNTDSTVTDNLTGLVWLKNANCFGLQAWAAALSSSNGLANGACGLTDGSSAGDWRLPNEKELHSLIDLAYFNPALSNAAGTGQWTSGAGSTFSGVQSDVYWSSSTYASSTTFAWIVYLYNGSVYYYNKANTYYVWPVRD
jgi:hypothetical protein